MGNIDSGGKRTIHHFARAWAEFVVHERGLNIEAELSGEFQIIARATDILLQVHSETHGRFLMLSELQTQFDVHMSLRLSAYAALAREKYHQDVYVVVVYLLPPAADTQVVEHFHSEFLGQVTHQDFAVIRIWELDAAEALALDNPALLPFVPLMRGGATEAMLRSCAARVRREEQAAELEVLLATFAGLVMDVDTIKSIVRWNMNILRESVIYKELFKDYERGLEDGLEIGREEGREEGRDAMLLALTRLLSYRFHIDESVYSARFAPFNLATLRKLTDAAFDVTTLAEFEISLKRMEETLL